MGTHGGLYWLRGRQPQWALVRVVVPLPSGCNGYWRSTTPPGILFPAQSLSVPQRMIMHMTQTGVGTQSPSTIDSMISFDPSDIVNWADKPEAHHKLPELVRRLILATVPRPSELHMPDGSSVWRPGWDGMLIVENGNTWVPKGASSWEWSCDKQAKGKATADYKKRTADPKGVDAPTTAFMFVTPRKWNADDKRMWATNRVEKRDWADVRALNVDDLVAWLGQAPAVALWFARLIGKIPATGVVPLDQWWENWSTGASPRISPELVTAGRQDQAKRIVQWFQSEPSHYYVQGETEDEGIAFLAGCARINETPLGSSLLARALVVENADSWRSLEGHSSPLVLVRAFLGGNVSPQIAVGKGHHALTPLGAHQDPRGNGITLPKLGRAETLEELAKMGLSETRARALAQSTSRNLPILRRRLEDDAGEPTPRWATSSSPRSIATLVLIGQWDGNHKGDRATVSKVAGQSYEAVERDLADLMSAAESPLTRVGNRWRFTSHEEAWHLLAPRLTPSDVERFKNVATDLLSEVSPRYDLPIEERFMANVNGKVLSHSDTLREGVARSLALMGTRANRAKNVEPASHVPARVVSTVLGGSNDWRIWATLSDCLNDLAEASPEALLDAIERDLDAEPSPFKDLFNQEGDGFFGETPHTGLLFALETLAWSPDHFSRVAKCLARLTEIDPGGQISNRPEKSLVSLFLPWIRFSGASDEHRLDTLEMLVDVIPNAGWRLLIGAYPPPRGLVIGRDPPTWQPWAQDGATKPTAGEYRTFVGRMTKLLLSRVGTEADRWAGLVEIIPEFTPNTRKQAIELLSQRTRALEQHPAGQELWTSLRCQLHHHRSYPDAAWAMDAGDLAALEAVYQQLTPPEPVKAHSWPFDNWPDLPEGKPVEHDVATERIAVARQGAVRAAYSSGGVSALLAIARVAEEPFQVGVAVALAMESALAIDLAVKHSGSPDPKSRDMALGCLRALYVESGWAPLEAVLTKAKASGSGPQALADIHLATPGIRQTWQRLNDESQEVRTAYWKSFRWFNTSEWGEQDLAFVVQQLISVRRSVEAVEWLTLRQIPSELAIQLLEAVPLDVAASPNLAPLVDDYRIAELFKVLDHSVDVSDDVIARLEIPYIEILNHHRPDLALHRQATRDPALFADVITWAFRRADGKTEESVDDQERERRATVAFTVLWNLHSFPGRKADGSVDAEALSNWVNEARRMCRERDRGDIGDQQIGQILANAPAGVDGIWPCEPVRDLLDDLASPHIGRGFTTGKINLRGITSRGVFEGGAQERSLADNYRQYASRIAAKWPFTAKLLRQLAIEFKDEAGQHDQDADWSDQFE